MKFLKSLATVASWAIIICTGLVFVGLLSAPTDVIDVAGGFFVMLVLSLVGAAWLATKEDDECGCVICEQDSE